MIRCNCNQNKEFKTQSAYRQHIKSNKHQLWVMRNKELDMDVYCDPSLQFIRPGYKSIICSNSKIEIIKEGFLFLKLLNINIIPKIKIK